MLRSEIQKETGLTRKAIEYYEDKGLIHPQKSENGYRDYSTKDLEILKRYLYLENWEWVSQIFISVYRQLVILCLLF